MKMSIASLSGGALLVLALAANANTITGSISFDGTADIVGGSIVSYTGPLGVGTAPEVIAGSQTGAYASVPDLTPAAWSAFSFNPADSSVKPLWTFTIGLITYSFDATSVVVNFQNSTTLNISGTGIAHITGFDDTLGNWSATLTGGGSDTFTFGADTGANGSPVPSAADGGTTAILLGSALSGLALLRNRLERKLL